MQLEIVSSFLYVCALPQLKASHPYAGDDEDELCFEKGDIILVIPFEDPEDEVTTFLLSSTLLVYINNTQLSFIIHV